MTIRTFGSLWHYSMMVFILLTGSWRLTTGDLWRYSLFIVDMIFDLTLCHYSIPSIRYLWYSDYSVMLMWWHCPYLIILTIFNSITILYCDAVMIHFYTIGNCAFVALMYSIHCPSVVPSCWLLVVLLMTVMTIQWWWAFCHCCVTVLPWKLEFPLSMLFWWCCSDHCIHWESDIIVCEKYSIFDIVDEGWCLLLFGSIVFWHSFVAFFSILFCDMLSIRIRWLTFDIHWNSDYSLLFHICHGIVAVIFAISFDDIHSRWCCILDTLLMILILMMQFSDVLPGDCWYCSVLFDIWYSDPVLIQWHCWWYICKSHWYSIVSMTIVDFIVVFGVGTCSFILDDLFDDAVVWPVSMYSDDTFWWPCIPSVTVCVPVLMSSFDQYVWYSL